MADTFKGVIEIDENDDPDRLTEATTTRSVAIGFGVAEEHAAPENEFRTLLEHEPEGLPPDHRSQLPHFFVLVAFLPVVCIGVIVGAYLLDGWPAAALAGFLLLVFLLLGGLPGLAAEAMRSRERKQVIHRLEVEHGTHHAP